MSDVAETTDDATETGSVDTGAIDTPAPQSNPWDEQLQSMEQRITSTLDERLPAPAETDDKPGSLADAIFPMDDTEVDQILSDDDTYDEDGDVEIAALDQYVDQRAKQIADEAMAPYREAEKVRELNAIQDEYPDILEPAVIKPITEFLQDLVDRHQNEELATDPAMIRMAYKATKAESASADEVTAESAATRDATLETAAGPSHQGEADPDDAIRNSIMAHSRGGDAF